MIRSYTTFVFAVLGVGEEIESAIAVLNLRQIIRFPFGLLKHITDTITALRDAKIVEGGNTAKRIDGKDEVVNQTGAVNRIFAVVAGIVMSAGSINGALSDAREPLRRRAIERRGGLNRVDVVAVAGNCRPRETKRGLRQGDAGGRGVANCMGKAGVRHGRI